MISDDTVRRKQNGPSAPSLLVKRLHARARRYVRVCHFHTHQRVAVAATQLGRSKAENMAAALKPASPTVPTAAPDKQYYNDDDQKSCGVHTSS
jgi:hypothetical protein